VKNVKAIKKGKALKKFFFFNAFLSEKAPFYEIDFSESN
jgi:hypothetical protein